MSVSAELLWFRLRQGKVWHLACGGASVGLCGEPLPARGERQPKRPPFGGRPCPSCVEVSALAEFALAEAERVRRQQSSTTTTTTRLYEHDLTDPDGRLSGQEFADRQVEQAEDEHPKRQVLAAADAEYRDQMEMAEGQP